MYNTVATGLLIATILFFLVYKRKMLTKILSIDIAGQVKTFEQDIEKTANSAVDRIADVSGDLSSLLSQAEDTIEELKLRVKIAEEQLYKISMQNLQQPVTPRQIKNVQPTFAEQLAKASYQTALHLDVEPIQPPRVSPNASPVNPTQNVATAETPAVATALRKTELDLDMASAEPKFRQKQILRLAANGYDDLFIARALRLGVSEVSLTRKLEKNKNFT